eukprot:1160026-Pelagomonas_calceolata.AAC.9
MIGHDRGCPEGSTGSNAEQGVQLIVGIKHRIEHATLLSSIQNAIPVCPLNAQDLLQQTLAVFHGKFLAFHA